MFPFSAFIVSVPSVVVASAAPGLPVQVTGPIAIHIVQNLKAVHHRRQYRQRNSQIAERSGQPHTDIPNITNRYGDNPEFIDIRVYFIPSIVIRRSSSLPSLRVNLWVSKRISRKHIT